MPENENVLALVPAKLLSSIAVHLRLGGARDHADLLVDQLVAHGNAGAEAASKLNAELVDLRAYKAEHEAGKVPTAT